MKLVFGTDGVRGRAGQGWITPEGARRLGWSIARWVGPGAAVLLAEDGRPSGEDLLLGLSAGLAAGGATPQRAGRLTTPALALALADRQQAGVMITASHNPAHDNGFKVFRAGGKKLREEDKALLAEGVPEWTPEGGADPSPVTGLVEGWLGTLGGFLDGFGLEPAGGWVFDLAYGAAQPAAPWLAQRYPDSSFLGLGEGRINDQVGTEHLSALQAEVRRRGAPGGLALDGDGDRCALVDEVGALVPGDALIGFLARALGVRRLAVSVMSSQALERHLPGVEVLRTPVGDEHLERALAAGAELGGEESGHLRLRGLPTGDGLAAGLLALGLAGQEGALSKVFANFQPWPRRSAKLPVTRRVAFEQHPGWAPRVAALRSLGGRELVRYSGTEPVLRLMVEHPSAAVAAAELDQLLALAREAHDAGPS